MTYVPKGATAAERAIKRARAQGYRMANDARRERGELVLSPSANRRRRKHGRAR